MTIPYRYKEFLVIPAKAGIHLDLDVLDEKSKWIAAFVGMTNKKQELDSSFRWNDGIKNQCARALS